MKWLNTLLKLNKRKPNKSEVYVSPGSQHVGLNASLDQNKSTLLEVFKHTADFHAEDISIGGNEAVLLWLTTMTDANEISSRILQPFISINENHNSGFNDLTLLNFCKEYIPATISNPGVFRSNNKGYFIG